MKYDTYEVSIITTMIVGLIAYAITGFVACDRYNTCIHDVKDAAVCGKP